MNVNPCMRGPKLANTVLPMKYYMRQGCTLIKGKKKLIHYHYGEPNILHSIVAHEGISNECKSMHEEGSVIHHRDTSTSAPIISKNSIKLCACNAFGLRSFLKARLSADLTSETEIPPPHSSTTCLTVRV